MFFPRYWKNATVSGPNREGETFEMSAWGWSDVSEAEALEKGKQRATAALARLPATHDHKSYYGGGRPFREPILDDLSRGTVKALVTRNSLGCDVLNTDCVAFADLDYEPPQVSFFANLFGSGKKQQAEHRQKWENQALNTLANWQSANRTWSFRVYRTAGGLRILVTSHLVDAADATVPAWLQAIGSDPLYQRLCADQKSFRARLTPKPWRCGVRKPPAKFPFETPKAMHDMERWLQDYQQKSAGFSICSLVQTLGAEMIHPEIKPIADFHDERTFVATEKPLA